MENEKKKKEAEEKSSIDNKNSMIWNEDRSKLWREKRKITCNSFVWKWIMDEHVDIELILL